MINFNNKDSASILVDEEYSVYSDIYNNYFPVYSSKENYDGKICQGNIIVKPQSGISCGRKDRWDGL